MEDLKRLKDSGHGRYHEVQDEKLVLQVTMQVSPCTQSCVVTDITSGIEMNHYVWYIFITTISADAKSWTNILRCVLPHTICNQNESKIPRN